MKIFFTVIINRQPKWIDLIYRCGGVIKVLRLVRIWILAEYWLRSFVPWLASILLDVAVEDDVVQDPAHVVFIIIKISYNTKPMVILHFLTLSLFWLKPTVFYRIGRGLRTTRV
jgi:hypothetical protein